MSVEFREVVRATDTNLNFVGMDVVWMVLKAMRLAEVFQAGGSQPGSFVSQETFAVSGDILVVTTGVGVLTA